MWYIDLHLNRERYELFGFEPFESFRKDFSEAGVSGTVVSECIGQDCVLKIASDSGNGFYFAVRYEGEGEIHTFSGAESAERLIRQSPHDTRDYILDFEKEAIPMAAVLLDGEFTVAIADNPYFCDNATTQHTYKGGFSVASGDPGTEPDEMRKKFIPRYHSAPHAFTVMLTRFSADSLSEFRNKTFASIDRMWGEGGSPFHSVCFSSNYMHYRKNDTGYSDAWIVPGIDYATHQYMRDSFWQSFILPPHMAEQCYRAFDPRSIRAAENALFYVIWSYRVKVSGGEVNKDSLRIALDSIAGHSRDGCFVLTGEDPFFRSWYDICGFEDDDVVTYNQGLLSVAMRCARELGEDAPISPEDAARNYEALFNGRFIPLSRNKQFLSLDVFIGDVLYYILFNGYLLSDATVRTCYEYVCGNNSTPYGMKVVCAENGDFLPMEAHGAKGKMHPHQASLKPGEYAYGGSYYLYEMFFHLGGYLHGAEGAEDNLIKRGKLDFSIGGTYYEHVNTVTGLGNKPNQGWNAAIYSLWSILVERGDADGRFFREVDALITGQAK